ncbi:MAG: PAS domain-containing protein, partial [Acidimicrobiia bacterium]|nr:PAS domain-containing protein [Acidimicrobiia bacterium]
MEIDPDTPAVSARTAEVREMYVALLQGELSGTDALAASQQMLQILMDSMANAVFWKDTNSCYLGCNKVFASFAGVEPAVLVGRSDREMPWANHDEFSAEWFIDWDQAVIESGEPRFGILEQLQRADGENRWLETNKVPLRDINGEVIGVLGTFEDVTDRHLAERELQRTLDELDERVQLRTNELMRANESLRREVEDRVRLQAEERQQRAYAEALRDTAAAMSQTFDLEGVTEQVLAGVERLVSNDLTAIVLVNAEGDYELSRCHAGFGYDADPVDASTLDLASLSVIEQLAASAGPVIVADPASALGPAKSVLGARMRVADRLVGYLLVESATPGFFTDGHSDRLGAIADQAAAVISNARLASRSSELAAAEERQRLARELHDAVNQTLWTASLIAESLLRDVDDESELHRRVDRLGQLTRGALAEMRALLLELRPSELAEISLDELIEYLLAALECRRSLDVTVELDAVKLDPAAHITFYRIAQEGLGNAAHHAEAASLSVRLSKGPPTELVIVDDGRGFDPEAVPAGHFGLTIMRERA